MILGIKSKRELFLRHLFIGLISVTLVYLFWLSRSDLPFDIRVWRALGDSAFSLLFVTLLIGPLSRLWKPFLRLVSWRRETGIWFALLALTHFVRVIEYALFEPGIELPRLLGLIALFWALVLAATSSDRAVNFLGISSWKWLHSMAYVIFYLISAHAAYFLFWRYPELNWFQYPFLIMAFTIPIIQIVVFIKEVIRQKSRRDNLKINKLQLPIIKQNTIAEKTNEIYFDLSKNNFNFLAGQHIRVSVLKLLHSDPRGVSRLFSITSSPKDKSKLSIAFRDTGSGFKKTLMEVPIGTLVNIEGPFGSFTIPKENSSPIVFIAGGIGITPFLSIMRFISENKVSYPVTLLYFNRNKESAAYLKELEEISKNNPNIAIKNKYGYVDIQSIKESVENIPEKLWYVAGPLAMTSVARDILFQLGVDSNKIYFEEFTGYE